MLHGIRSAGYSLTYDEGSRGLPLHRITGHPDGEIPSHRAGSLYDITVPPPGVSRPAGSWNHARLLVEHGHIRDWLNGTPTADVSYDDDAWRHRVGESQFARMRLFGIFPSGE